jgi:hypothetical protein
MILDENEVADVEETGLGRWGLPSIRNMIPSIRPVTAIKAIAAAPLAQHAIAAKVIQRQAADARRIRARQAADMKKIAQHKAAAYLSIAQKANLPMPSAYKAQPAQAEQVAEQPVEQPAETLPEQVTFGPEYGYTDMPVTQPGGDVSYAYETPAPDTELVTATAEDYQYDPTQDTGESDMQLSNIESSKLFPSNTFRSSGMGDIWSDLMTTGLAVSQQRTAANIATSQAAQAAAAARIAEAQAAQAAASQPRSIPTPVMLAAAAALAGVLFFMRRKRRA